MNVPPMFSIVIVAYNSAGVLADCLHSIPTGHQVIVVDNVSNDGSAALAGSLGAEVIRNTVNEGFGSACNRGAAIAQHEALLFLNPDARLQPDTLERLAAAMARYPDAGAFNPRLVNADGRDLFRGNNGLIDDRMWFSEPASADRPIPMAVGAALLFRKSVFDRLGGFDRNIFLYFEDDDLSARAIKAGYTLYHVHDALCVHFCEQSSAPSEELNEFKAYHFLKAKIYTMAKHGRPLALGWMRLRYGIKLAFYRATFNDHMARRMHNRLQAVADSVPPRDAD